MVQSVHKGKWQSLSVLKRGLWLILIETCLQLRCLSRRLLATIANMSSQLENGLRCINHYRSQRSWGKVMFLHVCVILFTGGVPATGGGGGGWCLVPGGLVRGGGGLRRAVRILLECILVDEVSINKITFEIGVNADDWTTELAIFARNASCNHLHVRTHLDQKDHN